VGSSFTPYKTLGADDTEPKKTGMVIKAGSVEAKVNEIVTEIVRNGLSLAEIIKHSGAARTAEERMAWQLAIDVVRKQYPAILKGEGGGHTHG